MSDRKVRIGSQYRQGEYTVRPALLGPGGVGYFIGRDKLITAHGDAIVHADRSEAHLIVKEAACPLSTFPAPTTDTTLTPTESTT